MQISDKSSITIVAVNTILMFLSQWFYFSFLYVELSVLTFVSLFIACIILPINVLLWISKLKVEFYKHWVNVYLGFLCSVTLFYIVEILTADKMNDMPPGDIYFDLFLTIFIMSFLKLVLLIMVNGITFLIYKIIYGKFLIERK